MKCTEPSTSNGKEFWKVIKELSGYNISDFCRVDSEMKIFRNCVRPIVVMFKSASFIISPIM